MTSLDDLRHEIDLCDTIIANAYLRRLALVNEVAKFKKDNNINILQVSREDEVIERITKISPEKSRELTDLYRFIMDYSKVLQK